jgi:hypothetical protein
MRSFRIREPQQRSRFAVQLPVQLIGALSSRRTCWKVRYYAEFRFFNLRDSTGNT